MVDDLEDLEKLPKTHAEACSSGSMHYFTGKPCKLGHVDKRYASSKSCFSCAKMHLRNRRKDPEYLERERNWSRRYKKAPARRARNKAHEARRRHLKVTQTPSWADLDAIREFYENCPEGYQVDHIIPLKNGVFPSFHSLENLQYLPARENISKGKKVDPLSLEHYPCCVLPGYRSYVSPQSAGASLGVLKFNLEDAKMEETP